MILIGHNPPPITGQSEAFAYLLETLESSGFNCRVVDIGSHLENRKVGKFSFARTFEILLAIFNFIKHLLRNNTQAVYISVGISKIGFIRDLIFLWLSYLWSVPVLIQLHGGGYKEFYLAQSKLWRRIIKKTLSIPKKIIVLSSSLEDQFDFLDNYSSKIEIIHNTAIINLSNKVERKDKKHFTILYMSNLIESKGYLDLLEAAKYLKNDKIKIIFCGAFIDSEHNIESTLKDFLSQVEKTSLYGNVEYLGVVSGKQKWEIYQSSDVFVLPTYYQYEGQPISIIEAMAFGLPIISTDYRGIKDMVINNVNGFYVNPQSPKEIAEKIKKLFEDQILARKMGEESKRIYEESFSPEVNRKRNLDLFASIEN